MNLNKIRNVKISLRINKIINAKISYDENKPEECIYHITEVKSRKFKHHPVTINQKHINIIIC